MLHLLLDRHNGVPVFRQIVDQIRRQAASGDLPPGEELPSTRKLAAEQGVNPMTVSKAFAELEREGVLDRRPGRPHVVAQLGAPSPEAELDAALAPLVQAVRQLGIPTEQAVRRFAALLDQGRKAPSSGAAPSKGTDLP